MPDFNIESFYHCESAEYWSTQVMGSQGTPYTVRWDNHSHRNHSVQYDYSCTCRGYKGHGKCRHITEVIAKNLRCGWSGFTDGGEVVRSKDGDHCPRCGASAHAARHAV